MQALRRGGLFLALSVLAVWESWRVGLGTLKEPGSGFLSFCAGAALAALSLVLILKDAERRDPEKVHSRRPLLAMLALLVYSLLLDALGFLVATLLLTVALLSLGIPTGPSMALLLGALMIFGVQPGPLLIGSQPDLFWGVVASMYIGNAMLLVLNLPLIGLWIQILRIPYSILYVVIVVICQIGAYSINNRVSDVLLINLFGIVGYLMKRYGYEGAPLVMGLVLGGMLENSLRRALMFSYGDPSIFLTRPISAFFLLIALFFLISPFFARKRIGEQAIAMQED